ncbi:MAG: PASTA domain-containing protein, partial [Peptococcaceae bacterium]|nr:PASTA domain-containing protein [Peptococcaceae bacterium]
MSEDFLSQFSQKNYNRTGSMGTAASAAGAAAPPVSADSDVPSSAFGDGTEETVVTHKGFTSVTSPRLTRADIDITRAGITAPEHDTEIDSEYNKRKLIRYGIIAGTVIAVAVLIYLMISLLNQVTVKNFVGTSINDAKTWGITNKISIETETVYNTQYDNNSIITQSKEAGKKIRKGSVLAFQVSQGPDPDERIELPDFADMTINEVYAWKDQNKANSANIMQENSDTVEAGRFIRREFSNASVSEDTYTRKDGLLIYMSKGPHEKNITVPDFQEKSKAEVESWVSQNNIEATYTEASSEKIPKGMVISQSIEPGEKTTQKSEMAFVISSGKAVVVPNFGKLTKD